MKSLHNSYLFGFLLIFVIGFTSCASIQKLVDQGRYDEAFALAARKLQGKKKKKVKYVMAMETAFQRLTERDVRKIKVLDAKNNPENWEKTIRVYDVINRRQGVLSPLLPLYANDGYRAEFKFVKVDGLQSNAKKDATAYQYNKAQQLLDLAKRGDKAAAREAWSAFETVEKYFKNYKNTRNLKKQARELGTAHIFFSVKNNAPVVLPKDFEKEILRMNIRDLNNGWNQYHTRKTSSVNFDFNITLNLKHIKVSPEQIREREYIDEKKIKDGFDYVLDDNGNVLKDSLGNDVKVDRFALIRAFVLETTQSKKALVSGFVESYNIRSREMVESRPFTVEAVFDNCAGSFHGDQRALSNQSKNLIGKNIAHFPTDEQLLLDAADKLKRIAKDELRDGSLAGL